MHCTVTKAKTANCRQCSTFEHLLHRFRCAGLHACNEQEPFKAAFPHARNSDPRAVILSESDKCRAAEFCEKLGLPCVVKPASLGSSVGVSIVRTNDEFFTALDSAFSLENTVIVEKYIKGREFAVGIVGSRVLPAIEIIPKHGFYDYKNKYQPGCTVEICPADIDSDTAERMAEATRKVFRVLGLGAYARADFMVDENGIYCLEANTLPGMTPVSLLPQEAAADKLDFPALLEAIIKESLLLRATERRH